MFFIAGGLLSCCLTCLRLAYFGALSLIVTALFVSLLVLRKENETIPVSRATSLTPVVFAFGVLSLIVTRAVRLASCFEEGK